jgi:hypothetical protein
MGCDAFANENGEFVLEIRDYETSEVMQVVRLKFPHSENKIALEILEGGER